MQSDEFQISLLWYKSYKITGCVFLVFWDVFSLVFLWPSIYQPALHGDLPLLMSVLAFLCFLFQLLAPNYWMFTHLINRTTVTLHNSRITVSHGPLPCWKETQIIAAGAVQYIWVEEHSGKTEDRLEWNQGKDEIYHVKAMLKNGESTGIFFDINNFSEAQQLRSRVRMLLHQNSSCGASQL